MSTAKHTPGPWHIQQTRIHPLVVSHGGILVARIRFSAWEQMDNRNATEVLNSMDECMANARLIAAAPNLLAALHHTLAALDDAMKTHPHWIYADAQNEARSAIAKAERRSP